MSRLRQAIKRTIGRRALHGLPPLRVAGRSVFILPTAAGWLFAVLLITMLAGATNYGNNLAFLLTFWLAATALVSMHRAHRNLVGLQIASVRGAPVFAGSSALFEIHLDSDARLPRRGLQITGGTTTAPAIVTASKSDDGRAGIHVEARRRGWLACPRLTIESRYPMGLFRCWTHAMPSAHTLVYPHPQDTRGPAKDAHSTDDGPAIGKRTGDTAFAGHRRFQPGDSLRHIDWKASARTDDLLVIEHSDSRTSSRWFDYASLTDLDREARLSQLAFWIVGAEHEDTPYGLRLPERSLGPAAGSAHYRACLKALALF